MAYEGTRVLWLKTSISTRCARPDLRAQRQAPHDGEVAQRQLAHDAAHHDEREEHPEQEIEEVVRRVDRGEADAERDADEELPLARELEPARRPHAACATGEPGAGARGRARGDRQASRGSERNGDARDDLAHGGLGLVARRDEAVGVRGEAHAVREDRDGEVVDVVGDAVVPAAEQGARAGRVPERHGAARSTRRARAAGDVRVARMSACR